VILFATGLNNEGTDDKIIVMMVVMMMMMMIVGREVL
jgi:hypothetical protein